MLGEALKNSYLREKSLFLSLQCTPIPVFITYSFPFLQIFLSISLSPSFFLYHFSSPYLIPPYSLINSNSFPLFISLGPSIKIVAYGLVCYIPGHFTLYIKNIGNCSITLD